MCLRVPVPSFSRGFSLKPVDFGMVPVPDSLYTFHIKDYRLTSRRTEEVEE